MTTTTKRVPSLNDHPGFAAAKRKADGLASLLAGVRGQIAATRADLDATGGGAVSDLDVKALGLIGDVSPEVEARRKLTARLADLTAEEATTARAVEMFTVQLRAERAAAVREVSASVRRDVLLPAVRSAAVAYLTAVRAIKAARRVNDGIETDDLRDDDLLSVLPVKAIEVGQRLADELVRLGLFEPNDPALVGMA